MLKTGPGDDVTDILRVAASRSLGRHELGVKESIEASSLLNDNTSSTMFF